MKKLVISIDMGAKYNGVFVVKTQNGKIIDKKAFTVVIDEKKINFSKKNRRENRHRVRSLKRRKLAKRLLWEILDENSYTNEQIEATNGLLKNRGYTFLSASTEFEDINDETAEFIRNYISEIRDLYSKEDFESFLGEFENIDELKEFIKETVSKIEIETKKKKSEFYKEYQTSHSVIKKDLNQIKNLFLAILNEIETGAKPRAKYLDDIKSEIEKLDFIKNKEEFFNLVGNISNFQLRVLRKYFNNKFDKKLDTQKLETKIKKYFKAKHYKSEKEKEQRKKLFKELKKDILTFLKTTSPELTIPPYEDMNNRDTYKCNSMFIKPELITEEMKKTIDKFLQNENFSFLLASNDGVLEKESEYRIRPGKHNKYEKIDFTYSKYLQRILDAIPEQTGKELNPRYVYKYDKPAKFIELFGEKIYSALKDIAVKYYEEESKILSGIYQKNLSIFTKCSTNTPYKNNIKHVLLKPLYSYDFTEQEAEKFIAFIENKKIDSRKSLKKSLEELVSEAKKYQNGFYSVLVSCFEDSKCVSDKEIKKIVSNLPKMLSAIKQILEEMNISQSYLNCVENLNSENVARVINILKQTYEICFKDLSGFNKTCRHCTKENGIRSDERNVMAKRLLSDVAKPIDGMLDMMLDRIAFEITEEIKSEDIKDVDELEILIEQNRFEFEENLNDIKRASDPSIKKYKRENKEILNALHCPYTGERFEKGEYDHILPQSREVYNSKANLIYVSPKGNKNKNADYYTLENLNKEHLRDIFKTENLNEIKSFISKYLKTIDENSFKNFGALNIKQQIAMRYALFMKGTKEFEKAFRLVRMDKIKTITNGTQKRLVRLIYEKLTQKFPGKSRNIKVDSKTVDSMLVSSIRNNLSVNNIELRKEKFQDKHSHCIDAMMVFYLANSKIKNLKSNKKETVIEPLFEFNRIYLEESGIKNVAKRITFINSPKKEIGSYKLFDETIYSEHYRHITKESLKEKEFKTLIKYGFLYQNRANKKEFVKNFTYIKYGTVYKIDVKKVSDKISELFKHKDEKSLKEVKFLDKLIYFTSRKEIVSIFFDDKKSRLLEFDKIKNIPPYSKNLYKSVYKKLKNEPELFQNSDAKPVLNHDVLDNLLKELYKSKQKNPKERKRGRKRHKYTLPVLGSPKFRVKRGYTWQILSNNDIATKNYIIDSSIKPIPFFSKNVIPVKINDLLDCLLLSDDVKSIYEAKIDVSGIEELKELKYLVSESKRCTVIVTFDKEKIDFDFDGIKVFEGGKDEMFKEFIEKFIDNKKSDLNRYIGSIRDGIKGKATLLKNTKKELTLQYKAAITKDKKELILKAYEAHNN